MIKLNEIRAFVFVARAGSVQAAATKLHMTQSAVSRLVQRLEIELGATLFDRQSKPLSLTPDGRIALDYGSRLLGSAEALAEALAPGGAPSGILRIGTAHALAETLVGRPLERLKSVFPDVTLRVSVDWATPLIARVERGDLEAAVITLLTETAPRTDLPARLVGKDEVRSIGSAKFASARYRTLAAMNEVGWAIQPEGCGYRTALTKALERASAGPPNVVVEAFGKHLQLSVVSRRAAFALMPAAEVAKLPNGVKTFSTPELQLSISTWMIRGHQTGRMARALDEVEALLLERTTRPETEY